MATLVNAVRRLVTDEIARLPEFTTPDPVTAQMPEVRFGWKANWSAREKVFTSNVVFDHAPASMRATKTYRNEEAGFDLVLLVTGVSQTEEEVSDRLDVLGGAVEDWVPTHASWDGEVAGLIWLQIEGQGSQTAAFGGKGVLVERTYPFKYRARLT